MEKLSRRPNIAAEGENAEQKGISVIVPAYNEEGGIGPVLRQLKDILESVPLPHEMIVVNDGSTDDTQGEISKSGVDVVGINHDINRGYGASLKTGLRKARYDFVVITDADGTYPNERIPEMVNLLEEGYDMVVGARVGKEVNIPTIRKPAKWLLNQLANYLTGVQIPDLNSGLRAMRREAVSHFMNILPNGFSFTTTITLGMLTNGYNVKFTPIDYMRRTGKSKIRPVRDTLNFVQLILRTVLYFEPLKIFLPVSIFIELLGLIGFLGAYWHYGIVLDTSFIVISACAVQLVAIGLLADLFDKRL